jgi:hypothetical protein
LPVLKYFNWGHVGVGYLKLSIWDNSGCPGEMWAKDLIAVIQADSAIVY